MTALREAAEAALKELESLLTCEMKRMPMFVDQSVVSTLRAALSAPQAEQPGFIAQIAATKDSVGQWPEWMQRAAITADAALPESQAEQRAAWRRWLDRKVERSTKRGPKPPRR